MEVPKRSYVPFDDALTIAGSGLYTNYVIVVTGIVVLSSILGVQVMGVILPVVGCELGLTSYEKGLLTSTPFFGMVAASLVFGILADSFGRRRIMLWNLVASALLTLLASLSPTPAFLMVIWVVNGFSLGGVFSAAWVYVSEFSPPHVRGRCILVPAGISSLGQILMPSVAWLVLPLDVNLELPLLGITLTSWRVYVTLLSVPLLLSWILLFRLPESPKFLLNRGREVEALEVLRSIYAVNNHRKKIDFPVDYICLDLDDLTGRNKERAGSGSSVSCSEFFGTFLRQVVDIFSPPLLSYTFLSIGLLLGSIGAYNSLILWFPEQIRVLMANYETDLEGTLCEVMSANAGHLGGDIESASSSSACQVNTDIFVITMIMCLLQSSFYLIISLIADRVGRKLLTIVASGLAVASCIGNIYADTFLLTVSSLGMTVVTLSVIFPLSFSVVLGYFPTSLRSTASAVTMMLGRLASGAGSQILGALFENHCVKAYWGIVGVIASIFFLSIIMPMKRKLT